MSVMSTEDRLVYMANQIARNFAVRGDAAAALATADHIAAFWDPSMKRRIFARSEAPGSGLGPVAMRAIVHLQHGDAPPLQGPSACSATDPNRFMGVAATGLPGTG